MEPIIETIVVGALEVNCYIFGCPEHGKAFLIDPGDNGNSILMKLEKLHLKPDKIINTHAHADHVGGIAHVKKNFDIPLLLHEGDTGYLVSPENQDMAAFYGTSPSPPADLSLQGGEEIELCSHFTFKAIHTPGHSPGGVCYHCNNYLFTGDTLFANSIGRSDLPGGSHEQLIRSIKENLLPLEDQTRVFPGHGPETSIGNEKKYNPFIR